MACKILCHPSGRPVLKLLPFSARPSEICTDRWDRKKTKQDHHSDPVNTHDTDMRAGAFKLLLALVLIVWLKVLVPDYQGDGFQVFNNMKGFWQISRRREW